MTEISVHSTTILISSETNYEVATVYPLFNEHNSVNSSNLEEIQLANCRASIETHEI